MCLKQLQSHATHVANTGCGRLRHSNGSRMQLALWRLSTTTAGACVCVSLHFAKLVHVCTSTTHTKHASHIYTIHMVFAWEGLVNLFARGQVCLSLVISWISSGVDARAPSHMWFWVDGKVGNLVTKVRRKLMHRPRALQHILKRCVQCGQS